jgi:hypothetical protein
MIAGEGVTRAFEPTPFLPVVAGAEMAEASPAMTV